MCVNLREPMPIKIRNLGKYGVVTDVDPYDLPLEAWNMGVNVRFQNHRIVRAPVYRNVVTLVNGSPRFSASSLPTSGLDLVVNGYLNGRIYRYSSGAETDLSIAGYVNADSELPYTQCHLADVFYVNRGDRVPWSKRSSDTIFQTLTGGWDSTWRCKLLRSCGSALVALNVTKAGTTYPTMVKTSALPLSGTVPSSWDHTVPSTLATENILSEMEGAIIDGQSLGSTLYIYGLNETWQMSPSNDFEVFNYKLMPFGKGSINANCAIEVGGRHYVFGVNDLWMHDGVTHASIADEKVRRFIYSTLNISKANRCFVVHNSARNEIHFCYVSGDGFIGFNGGNGCNRAAVFNYVENTWQFDDLPFVYFGCLANLDSTLTYATVTSTYSLMGGTYLDQEGSFKRSLIYVGEANAAAGVGNTLYAFDQYGEGSTVSFAVDTFATKGAYLERTGIDLDEIPNVDLTGYKLIRSIVPQGRIGDGAAAIEFSFGSSDGSNQTPTYEPYQTFNGADLYKVDFMSAGRFLSMRVRFNDYREMSLSGLDLDLVVTGDR